MVQKSGHSTRGGKRGEKNKPDQSALGEGGPRLYHCEQCNWPKQGWTNLLTEKKVRKTVMIEKRKRNAKGSWGRGEKFGLQ